MLWPSLSVPACLGRDERPVCKKRLIHSVSTVQQGSQKMNWKPTCGKVVRQARDISFLWTAGSLQVSHLVLFAINSQTARQKHLCPLSRQGGVDGWVWRAWFGMRWKVSNVNIHQACSCQLLWARQSDIIIEKANQADLRTHGFTQHYASCHRELPGLWGLDFLKGRGTSESDDLDSQKLLPRNNVPVSVLFQRK